MKRYIVRKCPRNPRTVFQQNARINFLQVSREWANLTDEERERWNSFAKDISFRKKGKTYTIRGFNLFTKLNRELITIERPFYKAISMLTYVCPPDLYGTIVEISTEPGVEEIKLKLPFKLDKDTSVIVFATPSLKGSREIDWKQLRVIMKIDKTFKSGSSIKDKYLERFGRMPNEGNKVGFAVKAVNNVCGRTNGKAYITPTYNLKLKS